MKPEEIKVAIYCEESQEVCKAFRARGFDAYSYDLQACSGGYPEWHVQGDIMDYIKRPVDLAIFHPTCRYITNSGVRWLHTEAGRWDKLNEACAFFNLRHFFNAKYSATENPIPHKYAVEQIGKYDQCFQPWQFGHQKMKATCLWLNGLPPLKPTDIVGPPPSDKKEKIKWQDVWMASPGPDREILRSKTYPGIAQAMAQQWGDFLLQKL